MDGAAEEVVVLLAGDPEQGGEAVGLHAVPALRPRHLRALLLYAHRAHGHRARRALARDRGHLGLAVLHLLVVERLGGLGAVPGVNLKVSMKICACQQGSSFTTPSPNIVKF